MILFWSLLSLTLWLLFCSCMPALLYLCIQPRGLTLWVTWCPSLTYLLPPLAMWDVVSLVLFATKTCDVRVRLPSALQEFCCCLGTCSLIHHGLCTFWTAVTNDLTWILLALVAPFSRGYVPAFVGEYVPFFFPQGVFRVFVSGRYTSNQCQPITGLSKVCA